MIRRPPRSTRTDTLFPYTTLFLSTPEGRLRSTAREVLSIFAGGEPEESTGGGTSDARFIAPLGAQCIEVGPVHASIHKVDEHERVADLDALPDLSQDLLGTLLPCVRGGVPDYRHRPAPDAKGRH